jgi:hypothetical protein
MQRFRLDPQKLREAVCLVISHVDPSDLGAVKLHKVLYYADMLTYLRSGQPITGATYKKRPFGPTNEALMTAIRALSAEQVLDINEEDFFGYRKKTFRLKAHCNYSSLSEAEADLLRSMAEFVCLGHTAKSISDLSHDLVWQMVDFGQDIPYHMALSWLPSEPTEAAFEEAGKIWQSIANEKPVRSTDVDSGFPTPLRKRMLERDEQWPLRQ